MPRWTHPAVPAPPVGSRPVAGPASRQVERATGGTPGAAPRFPLPSGRRSDRSWLCPARWHRPGPGRAPDRQPGSGDHDGWSPRTRRTSASGTGRAASRQVDSGRQFAATLTPASLQDGAARTSAHPKPEPVGLRPTAVVRLEGPLAHGLAPSHQALAMARPRPAGVGQWPAERRRAHRCNSTGSTAHANADSTEASTVRIEPGRGQTGTGRAGGRVGHVSPPTLARTPERGANLTTYDPAYR